MLPWKRPNIIGFSNQLADSYQHWTGRKLMAPAATPDVFSSHLYHAKFALVAHGVEADPVFCYANHTAQELWNIPWHRFVTTPSRLSAEPDNQGERKRLLTVAQTRGFIENYQGIRVTSAGKRFRIKDCIVWNILDTSAQPIGQAAVFSAWEWI